MARDFCFLRHGCDETYRVIGTLLQLRHSKYQKHCVILNTLSTVKLKETDLMGNRVTDWEATPWFPRGKKRGLPPTFFVTTGKAESICKTAGFRCCGYQWRPLHMTNKRDEGYFPPRKMNPALELNQHKDSSIFWGIWQYGAQSFRPMWTQKAHTQEWGSNLIKTNITVILRMVGEQWRAGIIPETFNSSPNTWVTRVRKNAAGHPRGKTAECWEAHSLNRDWWWHWITHKFSHCPGLLWSHFLPSLEHQPWGLLHCPRYTSKGCTTKIHVTKNEGWRFYPPKATHKPTRST